MFKKAVSKFNFIKNADFILTTLALLCAVCGIFAIYSATHSYQTPKYVIIQSAALVIGLVLMFAISNVDFELFMDANKYIFIGNLILLILVLLIGTGAESTGTKGWIDLGPVSFQPSEIAKIGFILTFANHLMRVKDDINYVPALAGLVLHVGIFIFLIMLQPDLGTAIVFFFIFLSMIFVAKISYKYVLAFFITLAVLAPLFWIFKDKILSPYQVDRILVFFDPYRDPNGSGFNVIQSEISIGSGKVMGKGFLSGSQNQLGYLPAKHTDFIFATIGEEWGFFGCIFIVLLLFAIVMRCIYIAATTDNIYGSFICTGISAMFLFHILENIGMCIQLMPVTGIPLPFISYGGTSLITNFMAIGFVNSVASSRHLKMF